MTRKVQSSLKWLLVSSRRDKRLAWRTQGQLQRRLRFYSTLEIKRIHHALICGAFCDKNKSLIKSVWKNYTKRYPRPFFLILWTSFIPQVMKMRILLANSHSSFIIVKWFLACQTNNLNCCFLILTILPASKIIGCDSNDPKDHGAAPKGSTHPPPGSLGNARQIWDSSKSSQ